MKTERKPDAVAVLLSIEGISQVCESCLWHGTSQLVAKLCLPIEVILRLTVAVPAVHGIYTEWFYSEHKIATHILLSHSFDAHWHDFCVQGLKAYFGKGWAQVGQS